MDEPADKPPRLDYETPPKASPSTVTRVVAGVIGGAFALFGALMLFYGIGGAVLMTFVGRRKVDAEDIYGIAMFIVIGALAGWAAFRCLRTCVRGR